MNLYVAQEIFTMDIITLRSTVKILSTISSLTTVSLAHSIWATSPCYSLICKAYSYFWGLNLPFYYFYRLAFFTALCSLCFSDHSTENRTSFSVNHSPSLFPALIIFPALILAWYILFFYGLSLLKCDLHENRELLFVHCCLSKNLE